MDILTTLLFAGFAAKADVFFAIAVRGRRFGTVLGIFVIKRHPENTTTSQNISNKLTRGTLKYSEAKEIAFIIGRNIEWLPTAGTEE